MNRDKLLLDSSTLEAFKVRSTHTDSKFITIPEVH